MNINDSNELPIIDSLIAIQRAVLSPNQCPANFPLPGKVERDKTIERLPVVSLAALVIIIFLTCSIMNCFKFKWINLLLSGNRLRIAIQTVHLVVEILSVFTKFNSHAKGSV